MPARFLTLDDVKEALAINATTAYPLVRGGDLPAIQVGLKRVWRIEATELEAYIERQYEATRKRIEAGQA
jgi:excisionase family DNA binding protein